MARLALKIPPLLLVIIFALLMWLSHHYLPVISLTLGWRVGLFFIFTFIAILLIALGALAFRQAQTTVNPTKPETSSALVNNGIYQYTRNPMYVGMAAVLIGWSCFLASPLTLVFVIGFVFYLNQFQIKPEEKALVKIFNDEYLNYCQQVRRWL